MDTNKCPVCGNPGIPNYLNEAVVCPHCGSDLKIYRKVSELVEVQTQATDGTKKYKILSVVLPLIAIAATATVCLLSNPKQQETYYTQYIESKKLVDQLNDSVSVLNAQIQKIHFYEVDESKVNEPVISATSKVFETSTKVSITGDEGTDIYYTLDGTEPTTSSLRYVNEFEVSATSTIKAIAVKGEKASFVSSFEVNKVTPFTVSNLIEWSSDKTGTVYQDFSTLTLNNAKVLFAIGDLVFLREDGKCIELYKMSGLKKKVETNAILSGTIKGCAESYNKMPEFIESKADATFTDVSALQIAKSEVPAEPVEATLAEVIDCQHIFDLVKISGVSLKVDNKKYSIYKGDEVVALNNVGTVELPAESEFTKEGQLYDIEGIVSGISSKKGTIYLRAIKAAEATGVEAVSADVKTFEAYNLHGVKVAPDTKGIVVINGKKYFNK